jgi:hypothetical protein
MGFWSRTSDLSKKTAGKVQHFQEQITGKIVQRDLEALTEQLSTILVGMDRALRDANAKAAAAEKRSWIALGLSASVAFGFVAWTLFFKR